MNVAPRGGGTRLGGRPSLVVRTPADFPTRMLSTPASLASLQPLTGAGRSAQTCTTDLTVLNSTWGCEGRGGKSSFNLRFGCVLQKDGCFPRVLGAARVSKAGSRPRGTVSVPQHPRQTLFLSFPGEGGFWFTCRDSTRSLCDKDALLSSLAVRSREGRAQVYSVCKRGSAFSFGKRI